MTNKSYSNVVVGNGWSSLGAVGFLSARGEEVLWITGASTPMQSPLPSLEWGSGIAAWAALARNLGIETGEPRMGALLREFRNKAFREAHWTKAPTPEDRREVRDECLWLGERHLAPAFETGFDLSLPELEERIRALLCENESIVRMDGVPATALAPGENGETRVVLASGESVSGKRVIWADPLIPKEFAPELRGRAPMSAIQALFTHESPIDLPALQGYYGNCHRESGEEFARSVWGCFLDGGKRSLWTLLLSPEEVEDNHEIAKKLRRMKQTIDRMFASSEVLPDGKTVLTATVSAEQVRFSAGAIFSEGEPIVEPVRVAELPGACLLTDGYGPSLALAQVAIALGVETSLTAPQTATPETDEAEASPQPPSV